CGASIHGERSTAPSAGPWSICSAWPGRKASACTCRAASTCGSAPTRNRTGRACSTRTTGARRAPGGAGECGCGYGCWAADAAMRMVRLLRRRRSRIVYRIRGLVPGKTAVVKCYGNWRDAGPGRNIMRAYGQDRRLVRLYAWRVWGGRGYLIMEYVPGPTVNELVRKMGPLPPERVVALASDVLKG